MAAHVLKFMESHQTMPSLEDVAAEIHRGWIKSLPIEKQKTHPHAQDLWSDHDEEGRHEHLTQAALVLGVFSKAQTK
eukprot:CAMPEP_0201550318 /NCGR_PEP_ID=MMETSP0173_2-20130828/6698_1 /ASSEMBLY_ACC=CAM_ASM_000268 /TAXON_ID=218659 /ORGANISM="Vexillifera sp., Strain DIVA3 564/2" /LENGTH=76 /DNA_ID=CAMNT_0047960259 /DNA_START=82 /DNA_END=312 /DNA_ORIENTATION=-